MAGETTEGRTDGAAVHARASRSAAYIGSFTLLGRMVERLAAFGQVVLIAAVYGTGEQADVYFFALIAPLLIGTVAGEAASVASLPAFVRRGAGPPLAELLSATFWLTTLLLTALLVVYLAVVLPLVAERGLAGSTDVGPWLAFAPALVAIGLGSYFAAVLLHFERYVWPPLRTAAATVAGLAFTGVAVAFTRDVTWLALCLTLGYAAALALLLAETKRASGLYVGAPSRRGLVDAFRLRSRLGSAALGGALGGQIFVLLERSFAATVGAGAVATLSYARGVAFTPNLLGQAVAMGIYPGMLRAHVAEDAGFVRDAFLRGLKLTLYVSAIGVSFFALFGTPTIAVLFERGAFTNASAEAAGRALTAFAIALLGTMLLIFSSRVFYAVDRFSGIVVSQLTALVLYLPTALLLRDKGTTGLAAAFSIAEAGGGLLGTALAARWIGLGLRPVAATSVLPAVRAAAPVVIALAGLWVALDLSSLPAGTSDLVAAVGGGALAVLLGLVVLWLLPWPELAPLRSRIRRTLA